MAKTREYWIQIENHHWDASPWGVNRLKGENLAADRGGRFQATSEQVLVLRRYTSNWSQPADASINPWDLNEPDPATTNGTQPGAVIEAKVGDRIVVHFRNMDQRNGLSADERTHSLHPHGAQHDIQFDGTFPITPPDRDQEGKRGDRVAPGETFTYHWTCPHRSSAGAWLYHDHAMYGHRSTTLGAFGVLLIRAPGEQQPDLPQQHLRESNDTATHFAHLSEPPLRGEYILVFHELPGVGLCLNGRKFMGNTPLLVAGHRTRMTFRYLNVCHRPLTFHMHGHRWEQHDRWVDTETLGPGASATLSLRADTAEHGGGGGEWMIMGRVGEDMVVASLVITDGGILGLQSA